MNVTYRYKTNIRCFNRVFIVFKFIIKKRDIIICDIFIKVSFDKDIIGFSGLLYHPQKTSADE